MPSYQNFRLWKWKELSHRRVFYLVLLQFMLTFLWLTVYYAVGESSYFTDKEQMIVRPLPLIVCLFHAVTCLLVWLTEKGRNLVRETQGKHICYWSAVSLVVNQLFQILLFKYTITERLSIQSAILFVAGSVIGMHTFHHLGASFLFLMVCKSLFVAWWIFFLSITRLSYAALLVLLGCLVIHHSFGVLTENEFFASFDRLKSASMSTWELVEDTVYAAGMIDDAITRCRVVIHPQLKTQLKTIVNQNYDESIAALNRTLVDELHRLPVFDQKHAILAESEYLCRALRFALKNDPEMLPRLRDERGGRNSSSSAYAQFTFLEACTTVISMLEFAVGHGLPIYVDDNAQKVNITGPQSILEVILLLLLYDCAHNTPGICILSCDSNAGEGWKLKVQTTTLHKRATGKYSPQPLDAVQRRAPRLISQGWLLAKSLLDAQSSEKRSCLERLADHISRKSLQEPVLETEPEYREGYKISYRSIALKNDVFSCAPTFGKPGAVTARLNSSSSLGSNGSNPRPMTTPSTEEEALMEEREQLPPPLLSSSSTLQEPERIHIDSWVFLVPRQQDANDLSDLKSKIDILALPTMGNISLPDLNKQNYSFSCGIISESYLKALGKQQCNVILRKIKQLVVAFDHKINSAEYFSFEYGVKGVETLPLHGSSLKQVFDCVQKVATKQGPRLVPGSPQQFASKPLTPILIPSADLVAPLKVCATI